MIRRILCAPIILVGVVTIVGCDGEAGDIAKLLQRDVHFDPGQVRQLYWLPVWSDFTIVYEDTPVVQVQVLSEDGSELAEGVDYFMGNEVVDGSDSITWRGCGDAPAVEESGCRTCST